MDRDRWPTLGPRRAMTNGEQALELVRTTHPGACQEGSTGMERTWTVRRDGVEILVAHHWCRWGGMGPERWWIRIAPQGGGIQLD